MGWWIKLWGRKPRPEEEKLKVFTRVAFIYADTVLWLLGSNLRRTSNGDDLGPVGGHIYFDELVGPRDTMQIMIARLGSVVHVKHNTLYLGWEDGHVYETVKHVVLSEYASMITSSGMSIMDKPRFIYCGSVDKTPLCLHLQAV